MEDLSNYQFVIIEKPYDNYQDSSEARDLLSKVWLMKLNGYKPRYPYGILPISAADWWANHIIFCKKVNNQLEPVTSFKSISYQDTLQLEIPFPLYDDMIGSKAPEHMAAARRWVHDIARTGELAYQGSWTMCPNLTKDKSVRNIVRACSQAMIYLYYTTYGIPHMIHGVNSKFGVHKLMEPMGFEYLEKDSTPMNDYPASEFYDERYFIMHVSDMNYSEECKHISAPFQNLWDKRLTVGNQLVDNKMTSKARTSRPVQRV